MLMSWGFSAVHAGQALAGLWTAGSGDDRPFALEFGMDGLLVVMKLPYISVHLLISIGLVLGGVGKRELTLKSHHKIWSLILRRRTPVCREIGAVHGERYRVLVVVGDSALAREGRGKPVTWADDGCFGVHVLSGKLLTRIDDDYAGVGLT